jgi:adenylate cyclase
MASPQSALQRERFRLFLRILMISVGIGAFYGILLTPDRASPAASILIGIANGLIISGVIAGSEIFLLREGSSMTRLTRLPFIAVVLLKTVVYGAVVTAMVVGAPLVAALVPVGMRRAPLDPRTATVTIGFALATTAIFVIVLQAAGLLGRRTFRNLVLGRYRRPRAERRFFLFVDVIGSTAIAERVGPLQAHRFLAAVFSATAEPVAACRGEIYQYVGDEIVVTWTEAEGGPEARALRCYFLMEKALRDSRETFRHQFAAEPGLRAALHLGEVIAGEVGEVRRAIVYHGDVMNTAARLEQATRDAGVRFIASGDAVDALQRQDDLDYRDLGDLALRGRKQAIRAWAVEQK